MAETPLSPAVQLAWQIAGDLALRCGDQFIEPKHLLYGVCSVGKVAGSESQAGGGSPVEAEVIRSESAHLSDLAQQHSLSLAAVRRAVRESTSPHANHSGADATTARVVSRSPAARQVFEAAAEISKEAGAPAMDLLSLFRSLLESGDVAIAAVTAGSSEAIAALRRTFLGRPHRPLSFVTSSASVVTDLDRDPEAARQPLQITDTLDADVTVKAKSASGSERLAWLSEFTWEFGTLGELESVLQRAADELLQMVPTAERNAILVRDTCDNDLLLKAHRPPTTTPRISMTSVKRAMQEKKGFIWSRGEDLTLSQKESNLETGMYAPLVVNGLAIGAICLDSTVPARRFNCDDLEIVTCFAHQLALAIANYELRTALKQNSDVLQRLLTNFSPQVRTRLLQRAQLGRLTLGGEHSVVSILCSDIRGFTRMSSGMSADDVVALLNEYFAALVDCIFRHDGTVDKFVGDAILAVFGSPEADPHHHRKAVMAAVEMQQVMQQVSQSRAARGEITCEIGIGVHAGEVLHGFIGSPDRMEFTIIGEAVNLAARYSDGANGSEILISPEVHQRVWRMMEAEQVSIPTKHEGSFTAYRVKGLCKTELQSGGNDKGQ